MNLANRITKRFDEERTFVFSKLDLFAEQKKWISTGSPYFDYKLRTLGFPTGIIEVRGPSQCGKTTLSLHLMGQAIKQYPNQAVVTILSSERRDNKEYALKMGIDVESIIIHRVITIEDAMNKVRQTITAAYEELEKQLTEELLSEDKKLKKSSDTFKSKLKQAIVDYGKLRFLFIWDSIGQTVSNQEKSKAEKKALDDEETGMAAMASAARAIAVGFRGIVGMTDDDDITMVCINRAYEKISATTGGAAGKKSYGGDAIEFYPPLRIEMNRTESIKVKDQELGQITEVNPFKTDYNKPKQKFRIEIAYGIGFVLCKGDIELGIEAGFLKSFSNGAIFVNEKGKELLRWTNREELYELYDSKHPLLRLLISKLLEYAHTKVIEERTV